LRLWTGLALALAHGVGKVSNLPGFTASVAKKGFFLPEVLGPAAALSELVGGLLLVIGLLTRVAATFVLVTLLVAGLIVHAADPFMKKELALTYAISALVLLLAGPGRYSLDRRGQTTS
jgi:putative oxidoreductase